MSEAKKLIDLSGQFEAAKEQTFLDMAEQARAAGVDEATLELFKTAFGAFGQLAVDFMVSAGDELKQTMKEVDRLKHNQGVFIERIEDLIDRADIASAKIEMLQTGEEPMTIDELEKSLDASEKA